MSATIERTHAFDLAKKAGREPYKVRDLNQAEFGRKEVGDVQLFGILGSGKKQVAYSKVNLNVINVLTSEVVFSVQGAGEYELSSREVLGFGGTQGYDSTLNGKVLDLSIREAVNRLVEGAEQGKWTPGRN